MIRIGQGFDAHAFGSGQGLRLGGVDVPFDRGLEAHSDGDVVIHALCDALLGAAGLGDMGDHFPASDPGLRGIDSRELLRRTTALLHRAGWRALNADVSVICERPRIAPHRDAMRAALSLDLALEKACVNVKGTTAEGMGFTGRGEGIAALAVVLVADADSC